MSFVDVLPVEPVTRDDVRAELRRDERAASAASAANCVVAGRASRRARARARRRRTACPSLSATKRSPGPMRARVDLDAGDRPSAGRPSSSPSPSASTSSSRAGSRAARRRSVAQRLARDVAVVERELSRAADLLALLVPLAGDHDDVARPRARSIARSIAARRSGSTSTSVPAPCEDLLDDRERILASAGCPR